MDTTAPNTILVRYSDLRFDEADELDKYIDEINKESYNEKDFAAVDSYKLMVKIIDLQGGEIGYEAKENVKSLASIQNDLSTAYINKAKRFEGASLKISNSNDSMDRIFKEDASNLRVQAEELSNLAKNVNSYQNFTGSMEAFYRGRSNKFAELVKSSRTSFEKDVLSKHSDILSRDSKYWGNVSRELAKWSKRVSK